MRSRKQRHKITIQNATRADNAFGEPIDTWDTYAVRWAEIKAERGTETFTADQQLNQHTVKFTIRYDSVSKNITEDMRVSFNSKIYDIEAAINYNEENKEIHLHGRYQRT